MDASSEAIASDVTFPSNVSIPAGDTTANFILSIVNDNKTEATESVYISFFSDSRSSSYLLSSIIASDFVRVTNHTNEIITIVDATNLLILFSENLQEETLTLDDFSFLTYDGK